ncbi:MAG: adenylate/guanylate cyclase domain-containing protein, partial [Actinomycetota bacterium]
MEGIPTGLVTYVFTDVEGSTRLWETHPEQMKPALARHDAILKAAIEQHGGHVFSHAGDGFGISFQTTAAAIDAVEQIQRGLGEEVWPEHATIRIRIGAHIGRSEERNGDYFGSAVNRAARLMSAGYGGQVLISGLVNDEIPDRSALDLGVHRLKDLSAPEHIYQLVIGGLPTAFPPLKTLDETKTSLPVRPVNLVGRADDLLTVGDLLRDHGLVTICGPGGVGKTTLAIQAAAHAAGRADGGVWLVELAPVLDPDGIPFAILDGMRAAAESGKEPLQSVVDAIGGDTTVLVIDNCEHLVDGVAEVVGALLDACPNVRVLATSREPLGIAREATLPIEPLAAADVDSPAVQLFVERAKEANPGIDLSPTAMASIVALCRRLDGLPLAIELAAARTRSFTPDDLNERLGHRFRVLRGRSSDGDRHATLRSTIEWSHQLLEPDERLLFERLSVFAGVFDLPMVEAVCADGDLDELDLFDLLDRLVQRSMVVAEVHGPKARFHLLQSLRDFAADELDESHVWRRRHATAYAASMRAAVADVYGPREAEVLAELDVIWDDVRVAVAHAREAGDVDLLEQLIAGLGIETMFRARTEVAEWTKAALAMTGEPSLALLAMGTVAASVTGDADAVAALGARYHEHAPRDPLFDSMDAVGVGLAVLLVGEFERALALLDLAAERASRHQVQVVGVWVGSIRGLALTYYGRPTEAAESLAAAKAILDEHPMGATAVTGWDLIDTLQMSDPPEVIVERMHAVSRAATEVRSRLVKGVADMTAASTAATLGDRSSALIEAADVLAPLADGGSATNIAQQFRRAAVMLLDADAHKAGLLILDHLAQRRVPDANPAIA